LEEYDNEKELIHAHLRTIIRLPDGKLKTTVELKKLKDTVRVALINLTNLGCQIDNWDPFLVTIISEKFGPEMDAKWSEHLGASKKNPSYKELSDFLNCRILSLPTSNGVAPTAVNNPQKRGSVVHNVSVQNCDNCNGSHGLAKCQRCRSLAVEQRRALVQEKRACFNCLRLNHFTQKCSSKSRCARCRRSHHMLLHMAEDRTTRSIGNQSGAGDPESRLVANPSSAGEKDVVAHVQSAQLKAPRADRGILPTAWVDLHTAEDRRVPVRALVDQCSTLSFISVSL